ncbi:hypothetical protein [Myroides marinus]|uniref:hypothetical protein n=1 Tax=Myroides marinus TaxID=703342 RepID=UPI002574DEAE|nr:hypothetical protein [Myroides marinus]MDM1345690.1 hypothetical protein [Myroides marinus]
MRGLMILMVLLLVSCGSRKVDKSESIQVMEQQSVKEVKNDLELSVKDSFVNRYVSKNSRFKASEIKIDKDGGVVISNPVIEAVEESRESAGVRDGVVVDKGVINSSSKVSAGSSSRDKKVDREQYSWWGVLIPLGVVLVVGYCIRWIYKNKPGL